MLNAKAQGEPPAENAVVTAAARPAVKLSVGIVLAPSFTFAALANFLDILRLGSDEGDRSRQVMCHWRILGNQMVPVKSSSGVSVWPDEPLGHPSRFDYIAIVGGLLSNRSKYDPAEIQFIRSAAASRVPLVGLCTASFLLAEMGLLNGYKCCVSWYHYDELRERFPEIRASREQNFIVDRDRITSAGGIGAALVGGFLVDRHIGKSAATKGLHIMMLDPHGTVEVPQPDLPDALSTRDPLVRRALLLLQERMREGPRVKDVCASLNVSQRKLERHFATAINMSPYEAFVMLRIAKAQWLLEATQMSISEIAFETGFCDVSHLGKMFRERMGRSPTSWRSES